MSDEREARKFVAASLRRLVDAAKPAACGACGGDAAPTRGFVMCRIECRCGASGPLASSAAHAVAAWNAMWAPRAGDATKRLMAAVRHSAAGGPCMTCDPDGGHRVWIAAETISAAVAELGLADGGKEGRG